MAKAKADSYKIVVKNGDTKYIQDKNGAWSTKTVDYISAYDTFAEALAEFISFVGDTYSEDKVSLVFKRGNK